MLSMLRFASRDRAGAARMNAECALRFQQIHRIALEQQRRPHHHVDDAMAIRTVEIEERRPLVLEVATFETAPSTARRSC